MVVVPPFQPDAEWSVVIGDCIQNLRAALDHVAWSLTPVDIRTSFPKRPQFPIFDDYQAYIERGQSRIRDIDPKAKGTGT